MGKITTGRLDIDLALERPMKTLGYKGTLKKLDQYVAENEHVSFIETTLRDGKASGQCVMVLTDQRILLINSAGNKSVEDISLTHITGVEFSKKTGLTHMGSVVIHVTGHDVTLGKFIPDQGLALVNAIRNAQAKMNAGTTASGPSISESIPEQLQKWAELRDSGIISEDEFAAQKAKLLG